MYVRSTAMRPNNSVYHSYNVNNVQLIDSTATVDLGVIIDGKLRFDKYRL